jgi:hypothetical protein
VRLQGGPPYGLPRRPENPTATTTPNGDRDNEPDLEPDHDGDHDLDLEPDLDGELDREPDRELDRDRDRDDEKHPRAGFAVRLGGYPPDPQALRMQHERLCSLGRVGDGFA